jgi:hypothetical protein
MRVIEVSRQPRSALTPHEQAPHEHSVCQDWSRCPAAGDDHPRPALCYVPLPSQQTQALRRLFAPLHYRPRLGAWPAPQPSTAGRASPPTLQPASIPHSVPVGTGRHHPRLRAWALLGRPGAQPHPSVADSPAKPAPQRTSSERGLTPRDPCAPSAGAFINSVRGRGGIGHRWICWALQACL